MGFEKSHLFGKVEIDIRTTVAGTIVFQTETPGSALANRYILNIPVCSRTVLRSRLPGTMQGHYVKATGTPSTVPPSGIWELYGVRIWHRQLPDGQWEWFPLQVMETPIEYVPFKIPELDGAEATPATYSEFKVPLIDTPALHTSFKVPLIATPEDYTELKVPVTDTPADPAPFKVPLIATPEDFSPYKVPVKPTPVVPEWVAIPVDE